MRSKKLGKVNTFTSYLKGAAAAAKSLQSCPTLCDPTDGSPSGSPVPGILQARTLEWVAISLSNAWKGKVKVKSLSCVRLHGLQPTSLLPPWDFPGKSTGVGCHCLLRLKGWAMPKMSFFHFRKSIGIQRQQGTKRYTFYDHNKIEIEINKIFQQLKK